MGDQAESDHKPSWIQIAAIDCNGVLRAKKLRPAAVTGDKLERPFGFASPLFGVDAGDNITFDKRVMGLFPGYGDILVKIDPATRRQVPWQDNIPFYLLNLLPSEAPNDAVYCARTLLQNTAKKLSDELGFTAQAGYEAEFHLLPLAGPNSATAGIKESDSVATPLLDKIGPYSITGLDSVDAFATEFCQAAEKMRCPLYSFHFEYGPSIVEASILHKDIETTADNAALIQFVAAGVGRKHGIRTTFMARPYASSSGASGHTHLSLYDKSGRNVLAAHEPRIDEEHPDSTKLSETGVHFLAGILECLPDITIMLCPTINSYKRLANYPWGESATWGLNSRIAAVRIIAPPFGSANDTRFEIRVPGSDTIVHYAYSALLAAGMHGITTKAKLSNASGKPGKPLPHTLRKALENFNAEDSFARKLFDKRFIEWYGALKDIECTAYEKAVTDWEVKRYL